MADILVLGFGYTGRAIAKQATGLEVIGTVRTPRPDAITAPELTFEVIAPYLGANTHVVVCFPPDGKTDVALASRLAGRALTYISSTQVYGDRRGVIDDTTPLAEAPSPRRSAEEAWHAAGATILRCPAIYGPDRGLHIRLQRGEYQIAGDGTQFTSRIHVDDLARLVLRSKDVRGETFVVGDAEPATQNDVCAWLSAEYGVPMPPHVPIESVHPTLRGDRRVDGSRALARLGVTLQYPSYRDGMKKL